MARRHFARQKGRHKNNEKLNRTLGSNGNGASNEQDEHTIGEHGEQLEQFIDDPATSTSWQHSRERKHERAPR